MKMRIYFDRAAVEEALRKANITPTAHEANENRPWGHARWDSQHWGPFHKDLGDELAYYELKTLTGKLPTMAESLEVKRVSIHALVPLQQNPHIKQGHGRDGGSEWEVEFGTDNVTTYEDEDSWIGKTYTLISVIRINVVGTNLQSVRDCYNRIRKGDNENNWRGEAVVVTGQDPNYSDDVEDMM